MPLLFLLAASALDSAFPALLFGSSSDLAEERRMGFGILRDKPSLRARPPRHLLPSHYLSAPRVRTTSGPGASKPGRPSKTLRPNRPQCIS